MRGGCRALREVWRRASANIGAARAGATTAGASWVPVVSRTTERRRCNGIARPASMSTLIPPGKTLGEVTHIELLEKEDPDAIVEIWREYHEGKNASFGARVNPGTYRAFRDRTAKCPMFVVPLHKSPSKFLTLVMQAKEPYASFTAIDDFRKLQEAATPMLVAAHYPELVESKGLVLVQAKFVDADTAGAAEHLTGQEALRLLRLAHKFYADDGLYEKFVKPFNHAQKQFDFDAYVAEVAQVTWSDDVIQ